MRDMEIDLKQLVKKILRSWRLLLIGMLVGIIIANVAGCLYSVQQAKEAQQALEEQLLNPDATNSGNPIVVPEVVYFSVKNVALGIFLGLFVVAGYEAVVYVFSGKLKSVSDISQGFNLDVIGTISCEEKGNKELGKVDQFIDRCFREKSSVSKDVNNQLISLDLCLAAKKQGVTNLYLTGNVSNEVVAPILKKMKASEKQISIAFEKLAIYSPNALENMLDANGVLLFERIGHSTYADIEKELQYCKRYEIPVLGCVIVE